MSSIVPHMLPRGPTSRNILNPSSAILRTVSSNLISPAQPSAISSRRWRSFPGSIGFAVAHEYSGVSSLKSTHALPNLRSSGMILAHHGVLNGRSTGRRRALMPASANPRSASSAISGASATVCWRGDWLNATAAWSEVYSASADASDPGRGEMTDASTHFGSPALSTALSTSA